MRSIYEALSRAEGNYEGLPSAGRFALKPVVDGRGFSLAFTATGCDGALYHEEHSTIVPAMGEKLTLWNFNSNSPRERSGVRMKRVAR